MIRLASGSGCATAVRSGANALGDVGFGARSAPPAAKRRWSERARGLPRSGMAEPPRADTGPVPVAGADRGCARQSRHGPRDAGGALAGALAGRLARSLVGAPGPVRAGGAHCRGVHLVPEARKGRGSADPGWPVRRSAPHRARARQRRLARRGGGGPPGPGRSANRSGQGGASPGPLHCQAMPPFAARRVRVDPGGVPPVQWGQGA